MGQIATLHHGAMVADKSLTAKQLQIIKTSVAPGLNSAEFDLFIEQARIYGLNPITKQIYGVVYMRRKQDADGKWVNDRQLTLITGIDGFRSIAARTGRYRPDEQPPRFEKTEATNRNPAGIESATVTVYYQDEQGRWHPVAGTAYWDEFAPISEKTGKPMGKWPEMPRLMLAKCAEAQALRRAFPEQIGGLYEQTEIDAQDTKWQDATASEIVEAHAILDRRALVGDKHLLFSFEPMGEQEAIPVNGVLGRLMDFYRDVPSLDHLEWFTRCNRETLKAYWAESPEDALEAKKAREQRQNALEAARVATS